MHPSFAKLLETLEPKYLALVNMTPVTYATLPRGLPLRGLYLFSEGVDHLYVGRTNRLRQRLRGHCVPSASHFSATFAFRMARNATGRLAASYSKSGSRQDLLNNAEFAAAFNDAKRRIATMHLRYVEQVDPTSQALLEIYAATVLKTPYNDFENH
jgi:predicted GIY-YIG superfamily endonuclease